MPFKKDPYIGASAEPQQVKLMGCFSRLETAPAIKVSCFLTRGNKLPKSGHYEHEQHMSITWPLVQIFDPVSNAFVSTIRHGTFQHRWVEVEESDERYLEIKFTSDYQSARI